MEGIQLSPWVHERLKRLYADVQIAQRIFDEAVNVAMESRDCDLQLKWHLNIETGVITLAEPQP